MNSQLTQYSVNETDSLSVSDEIRRIISAFVESAPITQEEVEKHLKVPGTNDAVETCNKTDKQSPPSPLSFIFCCPTKQTEENFTNALANCSDHPNLSNANGKSTAAATRGGGTTKRSGAPRTFINRSYNPTQLRQLLNSKEGEGQWQRHVTTTSSHGSPSSLLHSSSPSPSSSHHSSTVFSRSVGHIPPLPRLSEQMDAFRRQLPTWALRDKILNTIESSPVTLITGGTGCGKTTQVPQFLLENAAQKCRPTRIFCTQPRRLPAIAIARRVASERGERFGATVGYHIRLESNCSAETLLTYCTSGVLLRKLTNDELATEATHVILDEVHERETNTDYLLIALREALKKRKDLKVVLMSATMGDNRNKFMRYFRETGIKCVDVPTQLFSVEVYHLAEMLAMTGYMPSSHYGGMFDERSMAQNFPAPPPPLFPSVVPVNAFSASSQLRPQCFGSFSNSPWGFTSFPSGQCFPTTHPQLQMVPPDPFVSSTTASASLDGFLWNECSAFSAEPGISQKLSALLRDRPMHFLPTYVRRVREVLNKCISKDALIETYLDAGGRQWEDSVDCDLIAELICYLIDCQMEGGILVFLPGYDDIMAVNDRIQSMQSDGRFARQLRLYMLHSQLNPERQQNVFDRIQNNDWERKVVLSTNIAEASLTIDDIVFVIDCGKAKVKGYDHNTRVSQLQCQRIAKSNAEQRRGRAGRCQPGFCFRLYSEEEFRQMDDNQTPEMLRCAIHEVCLHAKMYAPGDMSVQQFLSLAPDPPGDEIVENSLMFLEQLGALYKPPLPEAPTPTQAPPDSFLARSQRRPRRGISRAESLGYPSNRRVQLYCSPFHWQGMWNFPPPVGAQEATLTELGRTVARLPLEPQLARLLLFGIALRCIGPVITLVAALSHRDPFVIASTDDQKQMANTVRDEFSKMDYSDHLMLIRAFNAFSRVNGSCREQWCWARLISESAMRMICGIRHQLFIELRRLHLLPSRMTNADDNMNNLNLFASSWPMVQGCIVAGAYPNIGFVRFGSKLNRIRTMVSKNCVLHPSSCLRRQTANPSKRSAKLNEVFSQKGSEPMLQYLIYQELVGDTHQQHMVRTVTAVTPLHILLFAGPVRMDLKCVKYFELVDPNGALRQQRKLFRDKILRKHRKEQRNLERELRRRHRKQLEQRNLMEQNLEEQNKKKQLGKRQRGEESEKCRQTDGRGQNATDTKSDWNESGHSLEKREQWQTSTDSRQRKKREENEELGESSATSSSDDSFGSFPAANSAVATPSSLSSSALSSLEPELAEELPEYMRSFTKSEPEEPSELLELDNWFGFRGSFSDLQMTVKLRFRLMDYLTRVLSHSVNFELSPEDRRLLDCLNETLTAAHRSQKFAKVNDL
ncbi:hypothetical protein niasHS_015107 [Heterodera schachtii]|uniref:Uncharacterized protein n=1 Tax=Heterodera schachtii TaxID=97005 RepID=A0ABD2I5E2_HETSC